MEGRRVRREPGGDVERSPKGSPADSGIEGPDGGWDERTGRTGRAFRPRCDRAGIEVGRRVRSTARGSGRRPSARAVGAPAGSDQPSPSAGAAPCPAARGRRASRRTASSRPGSRARACPVPASPSPVESLKYWSTSPGVGGSLPIGERVLAHALQRRRERLHVRDLARHQELECVLGAGVVGEVDQPLVDDLRAGLGGDVAAEVDVQLAGDLQVVGRPRVALRVVQVDAAAAADGDQRVGLGRGARGPAWA